jgi:hypothetical protein
MAETKTEKPPAESSGDDLVAQGVVGTDGNVSISSGAEMPPDEPGHKGAEINAGETPFDPNAARRHAEGRRPGMQDSERFQPAHWTQPLDATVVLEQEVEQLEGELKAAKERLAEAKKA